MIFVDFEHVLFIVFLPVLLTHVAILLFFFEAFWDLHLAVFVRLIIFFVLLLVLGFDLDLLLHALNSLFIFLVVHFFLFFLLFVLFLHWLVGILHLLLGFFINHIVFVLALHLLVEKLLLLNLSKLTIVFFFLFTFPLVLLLISLIISFIGCSLLLRTDFNVCCWEVRSCKVETVVVLGRNQQLTLLFSQVLVWVHASVAKNLDVTLKLLNLVQVVNEGF